ncbi:hypothetical protein D9M72_497940 [compost metagenome]
MQVRGRIARAPACLHAVAEHLSGALAQGVGRLDDAPALGALERVQKIPGLDRGDGQLADVGKQVLVHDAQPALRIGRAPTAGLGGVEFPRQRFEGVARFHRPGQLLCALREAGIDVVGKQLAGLVAPLPCLRQRDRRVDAQGQRLRLAIEPVVHAPVLACGLDAQVHAPAVRVALADRTSLVLHLPHESVCQHWVFLLAVGTWLSQQGRYLQKYRQSTDKRCYAPICRGAKKNPLSLEGERVSGWF